MNARMRAPWTAMIVYLVMIAATILGGISVKADDDPHLSLIKDAAGLFNERGYMKANSFSLDGDELINDFNGNLIYAQLLRSWPVSQGGWRADLKLTYNGSVGHIIHTHIGNDMGCVLDSGKDNNFNAPEWIISLNGVALQTFNFENEAISWASGGDPDRNSVDDDVSMLINGYHDCVRYSHEEANYHGIVSILMGDGSVKEFTSVGTDLWPGADRYFVYGEYRTGSADDQTRGFLDTMGVFLMLNADGTRVKFRLIRPQWRTTTFTTGWTGAPMSADSLEILLPIELSDQHGNVITVTYLDQYFPGGLFAPPAQVLGRPLVWYISGPQFECYFDWGGMMVGGADDELSLSDAHGLSYGKMTFATASSYPPSFTGTQNRAYVYTLTDAKQRQVSFAYERYRRHGQHAGGCEIYARDSLYYGDTLIHSRKTGSGFVAIPGRLSCVTYPEGGKVGYRYYGRSPYYWDTLLVDYGRQCTGDFPPTPCVKNPKFDTLGRDPFFANMVVAKRRFTVSGSDTTVISTDSLKYYWTDNGNPGQIDLADDFYTKRFTFHGSLPANPCAADSVKETDFWYRQYPEHIPYTYDSRDRGWAIKELQSTEYANCDGDILRQVRNIWDTGSCGTSCNGDLLLRSCATTLDNIATTTGYQYTFNETSGDLPQLDLTSKTTAGPWGDTETVYYNPNFLSWPSSDSLFCNTLADSVVRRDRTHALLSVTHNLYYPDNSSGVGSGGQLKQETKWIIQNGALVDSMFRSFQYYPRNYPNFALVPYCALRKLIDFNGDSTVYAYDIQSATGHNTVGYKIVKQDSSLVSSSGYFGTPAAPCRVAKYNSSGSKVHIDTLVRVDTLNYADTTSVEASSYFGTASKSDTISVAQTMPWRLQMKWAICYSGSYARIRKNGTIMAQITCKGYDQDTTGAFAVARNDIISAEVNEVSGHNGPYIASFKHYDTTSIVNHDTTLTDSSIVDSVVWYNNYDNEGRLTAQIDPNGYLSTILHDTIGRVKDVSLPYGFWTYGAGPVVHDSMVVSPDLDADMAIYGLGQIPGIQHCLDDTLMIIDTTESLPRLPPDSGGGPPPRVQVRRDAVMSFSSLDLSAAAAVDSARLTFWPTDPVTYAGKSGTVCALQKGSSSTCGNIAPESSSDPRTGFTISSTGATHANVTAHVRTWKADPTFVKTLCLSRDTVHYQEDLIAIHSNECSDSTKRPLLTIYFHTQIPADSVHSLGFSYDDELNDGDGIKVSQLTRSGRNTACRRNRALFDGFGRLIRGDALDTIGTAYDSTLTAYDHFDRKSQTTDQLGMRSSFAYDRRDREAKTKAPDSLGSPRDSVLHSYSNTDTTGLGFPANFNFANTHLFATTTTDENGHALTEYTDILGKRRLVKATPDGTTYYKTFFDYDNLGNLTRVVKPKGDEVRYWYNSIGWLVKEWSSDYDTITYVYDKAGNLIRKRDGNTKNFSVGYDTAWLYTDYDGLNRPVESGRLMRMNWATKIPTCRWIYDQATSSCSQGHISIALSLDGVCNYAEKYDYDPRGRLTKQTNYFYAVLDSTLSQHGFRYSVSGTSFQVQYAYNMADEIASLTYPNGQMVSYSYDQRGRLWKVGDSVVAAKYAALSYTARDQVSQMNLGGGLQLVDYQYNARGWLNAINNPNSLGADKFAEQMYYYGNATDTSWHHYYNGDIGGQTLRYAGESTQECYKYSYDRLDRLQTALRGDSVAQNTNFWTYEQFTYDPNGNRLSYMTIPYESSPGDTTSQSYFYDPGTNRLDSLLTMRTGVYYPARDHFWWYSDGSLQWQQSKNTTFGYDIFGELTSVTVPHSGLPSNVLSFGYSPSGDRVFKRYHYYWLEICDPGPIMEEDAVMPLGGDGGVETDGMAPPGGGGGEPPEYCTHDNTDGTYYVVSNGRVLAEYKNFTEGPSFSYIYAGDQRIAMRDGANKLYYYLNDHLGSARVVIDSVGVVKDMYHYTAFGSPNDVTTSTNQPDQYTGKPYDQDAGINLYYCGARYYDADLGRFTQCDPSRARYPGWGEYVYCAENPLRLTDPDGRAWEHDSREHVNGAVTAMWWAVDNDDDQNSQQNQQQGSQTAEMSLSSQGLDFIARRETKTGQPDLAMYVDAAGYLTIGYGHKIQIPEYYANGISPSEATQLLKADAQRAVSAVNKSLQVEVKQNQFDALVSLVYNAGPAAALPTATIMRKINGGENVTRANFTAWNKITLNGRHVVSRGLTARRRDEYELFSNGKY